MVAVNFFGRNQPLIHALDLLNQHQRAETRSASASDDEATRRLCSLHIILHLGRQHCGSHNYRFSQANTDVISVAEFDAFALAFANLRSPTPQPNQDISSSCGPINRTSRFSVTPPSLWAEVRTLYPSSLRHFGLKCEHFIRLPSDLLRVPCEQRNLQL